jgi:hypothetical protein
VATDILLDQQVSPLCAMTSYTQPTSLFSPKLWIIKSCSRPILIMETMELTYQHLQWLFQNLANNIALAPSLLIQNYFAGLNSTVLVITSPISIELFTHSLSSNFSSFMFGLMARDEVGSLRIHKENIEEEMRELLSTIQTLQIRVNGLFAQVLTILEIIVHHMQGQK